MKITNKMVMELNSELAIMGCPFRYAFRDTDNNPSIEIVLPSARFVDSFIINPTKEFFTWVKAWFEVKGIELTFNNTGTIMWSRNGWGKE